MDRTDENPFKKAENGTKKIYFEKLEICKKPGLECGRSEESNCIEMFKWCNDLQSEECPVLGSGIRTNNLKICKEYKFWRDKPCYDEDEIRCRGGNSGQCVEKKYWGVEGAKDSEGNALSCKDGSDLFRPIVKGEEPASRQPSQQQVWKTKPESEEDYNEYYKGKEKEGTYTKENTTGLWVIPESDPFKVPAVTEYDIEKGPELLHRTTWDRERKSLAMHNAMSKLTMVLCQLPI